MNIAFKTFGCRLNISETESIISIIAKNSFIVKDYTQADIIIVNTCTVTAEAEKKCIRFINQVLSKNKICISTGCFNPVGSIKSEKLLYFPLDYKNNISNLIQNIEELSKKNVNTNSIPLTSLMDKIPLKQNRFMNISLNKEFHSRAFLKIQDGCNHNCSYCKVHIVRGKEQSLKFNELVDHLHIISEKGFKEVVLTGINIAAYKDEEINFSNLIEIISEKFDNLIFQLSSIEINNLDEKFFHVIKNPNIKPYFHIPLQSGSNIILSYMKRPYNISQYMDTIEKIIKARSDSFLSTDIIVGFPYETIDTIKETEKIIRKIGFHHLHLFPFSKREGTSAFSMEETLSNIEKSFYIDRFSNIIKENKNKYINSFINKKDYFIVERIKDRYYKGRTYHNIIVNASYNKNLKIEKGDNIPVFIFGKINDELYGSIL